MRRVLSTIAKSIESFFKKHEIQISHSEALEIVALTLGHKSWNNVSAEEKVRPFSPQNAVMFSQVFRSLILGTYNIDVSIDVSDENRVILVQQNPTQQDDPMAKLQSQMSYTPKPDDRHTFMVQFEASSGSFDVVKSYDSRAQTNDQYHRHALLFPIHAQVDADELDNLLESSHVLELAEKITDGYDTEIDQRGNRRAIYDAEAETAIHELRELIANCATLAQDADFHATVQDDVFQATADEWFNGTDPYNNDAVINDKAIDQIVRSNIAEAEKSGALLDYDDVLKHILNWRAKNG
jgi:Glyoxalase superfamily protein